MRWGALPGVAAPGPASRLALLASRAPPVPGIRARDRFPGSSHVPGVAPRWCPFPTVRAFLLPPRTPRKSLKPIISGFSGIHTVSTERTQLSAPDGGYPLANSQAVHKSPCVAPGTPIPAVAAGSADPLIASFRAIIWCLELEKAQAAWTAAGGPEVAQPEAMPSGRVTLLWSQIPRICAFLAANSSSVRMP
jgi:hypothetical protein